jgi:hypothetical protein
VAHAKTPHANVTMREVGVDISGHELTRASDEMVRQAVIVVTR